ncbi:hypothetical protein AN618_09620 [Fervidicola ferrireducens]|uniref:Uncharacterized protein n=1 Tax=Fervidicola ferrireducens TaxID=520764 RepID=A0A140LAL7_9FIRM|nr:hypothetical protein [Fervidicola ferrireducens]KXG77592.1 hypothetical protein AN618_09620 [Fervidicola ferrireducens]
MAIKGWSDVVRLPRLGKIALGVKDEQGIPRAVDYFVVPPEVQAIYGPKPKELDILIPSEDIDSFFPIFLKRYGEQYGLLCRGDGEVASVSADYIVSGGGEEYGIIYNNGRFIHAETGEELEVEDGSGRKWVKYPCPYKECKFYKTQRCTEVATLNVILYKVPGILGVYSLDTGSFNSYVNIRNALTILRGIFGKVSFIPLKLKVRMQELHPFVKGKRIKTVKPVLYIDMGDLNFEQVAAMIKNKLKPEKFNFNLDFLPITCNIGIEPADEDEKPELLYPPVNEDVIDEEDEEYETEYDEKTMETGDESKEVFSIQEGGTPEEYLNEEHLDEEERDEKEGIFKALTPAKKKVTSKGVFTYIRAACMKGPFGKGELCEVYAVGDGLLEVAPYQDFSAEILSYKDGAVLVDNVLIEKSA